MGPTSQSDSFAAKNKENARIKECSIIFAAWCPSKEGAGGLGGTLGLNFVVLGVRLGTLGVPCWCLFKAPSLVLETPFAVFDEKLRNRHNK